MFLERMIHDRDFIKRKAEAEMIELTTEEFQKLSSTKIKEAYQQADEVDRQVLLAMMLLDERKTVRNLASSLKKIAEKEAKEAARMEAMWEYERQAIAEGYRVIAGTDEVGRGPLAGPVVAAAVVLPAREAVKLPGIMDSKKLSEAQREKLDIMIKEQAVAWAIAEVSASQIDELNILEASREAMRIAVEGLHGAVEVQEFDQYGLVEQMAYGDRLIVGRNNNLPSDVELVLVDGLPNPRITRTSKAIVKGDNKSISIAAASIIAKVYRDHLMEELDRDYPGYGLAENKGYPTEAHRNAVMELGASPIHRVSFGPVKEAIEKRKNI